MIKRLKLKFVLSIVAVAALIFTALFGFLNISMYRAFENDSDTALSSAMTEGYSQNLPKPMQPFGKGFERCITVFTDREGNITSVRPDIYEIDETFTYIVSEIFNAKNQSGSVYSYKYMKSYTENGVKMAFLNVSRDRESMKSLLFTSLFIGSTGLLVVAAFAVFLAKWAVRPAEKAFEKQQQFVSDASHELKTPLAVMLSGADALENEIGQNRWLTSIKQEISRLSDLVHGLLELTRYDGGTLSASKETFDLSRALTETALGLESYIYEKNRRFSENIEGGISINGDREKICRMAVIFLDNAVKYSRDGAVIELSLKKEDGKAVMSVYNEGDGIDEEEIPKIFDRFYRSDSSRNRENGGFGLGLAIAADIAALHGASVKVKSEKGRYAVFSVSFPSN